MLLRFPPIIPGLLASLEFLAYTMASSLFLNKKSWTNRLICLDSSKSTFCFSWYILLTSSTLIPLPSPPYLVTTDAAVSFVALPTAEAKKLDKKPPDDFCSTVLLLEVKITDFASFPPDPVPPDSVIALVPPYATTDPAACPIFLLSLPSVTKTVLIRSFSIWTMWFGL